MLTLLLLLAQDRDGVDFFERKIRPLLADQCYACHSAQAKKLRGNLRLDTREDVLRGGDRGPALVPGDPAKSLLLKAVRHEDEDLKMPPKQKLADAEIADLEAWIRRGAPDPRTGGGEARRADPKSFWSFQPLRRPEPPAVEGVSHPVDRFVAAKLAEKGLRPAPEADRRTLLRRLTFDLTGLPPTPEEVEAFERDGDYDRVVDRLLASPRYGERWGRHWLDVARYADTHGYDKDKRRPNAWPYRDWVIRALNDDKPWADFVREQLAGDLLRPGDPDGAAATGFIAAGPWDYVGHVEVKEGTPDKDLVRVIDRDEMVAAVGSAFLGLTLHCARCHDHKFDPIPQREYYGLQAVFAGVERGDRIWREDPRGPAVRARLDEAAARRRGVEARVDVLKTPALRDLEAEVAKLRREIERSKSPSNGWHSGISAAPDAVKWVQVDFDEALPVGAIRLVPARPTDFQDTPGFGFPVRFRVELIGEGPPLLVADHTDSDFQNPGDTPVVLDGGGRTAWAVRVTATRLWMRNKDWVFALAELQAESGGKNVAAGREVTAFDSIEAGRWSTRHLVDGFGSRRRLESDRLRDLEAERERTYAALVPEELRSERAASAAQVRSVERELEALPPPDLVYAALPRAPRPVHVLARGNVQHPREAAAPGAVSAVAGPAFPEGEPRAALAAWLVHPENAFAWRVAVNRAWHHHFGRGLVDTPYDFGFNGGRPTHPELLDWLACEFRDGGGSLKTLHRLLVTSAAYRRSGRRDAAAEKVDADNRLLWRANRRRLDAESVRDAILGVSGALDLRMGGPGFDLFAFKDDHSPHYDYATFALGEHPESWRRTVYRFAVRSVPDPFLGALDAPDPSQSVSVRHATNTALQSLALLNDPFVLRQAERLAARVPLEAAFPLLYGRPATEAELRAVTAHARRHGAAHAFRLLLNANEFVFVD